LSKERVRERSRDRLSQSARSACGTAEFRLTSPATRDARGDLSSVKKRLGKAAPAELCKALLVKERLEMTSV
jgi:hypothetical protein